MLLKTRLIEPSEIRIRRSVTRFRAACSCSVGWVSVSRPDLNPMICRFVFWLNLLDHPGKGCTTNPTKRTQKADIPNLPQPRQRFRFFLFACGLILAVMSAASASTSAITRGAAYRNAHQPG